MIQVEMVVGVFSGLAMIAAAAIAARPGDIRKAKAPSAGGATAMPARGPAARWGRAPEARFAIECREAVRWANRVAHNFGQGRVEAAHLLDGLLATEGSHASNIVGRLVGGKDGLRTRLWAMFPGSFEDSQHLAEIPRLPQSLEFGQVISGAIRIAEAGGSRIATTGHMLAALAELPGDAAAEVVRGLGITGEAVRAHLWMSRES